MNTSVESIKHSTSFSSDLAGITCSALCLAHCLFLPFLIATGLSSLTFLSNEVAHLILLGPVFILAMISFPAGFKSHQRYLPGLLAIAGLTFLGAALTTHGAIESTLTAAGAFILITAHFTNRRLSNG